MSKNVIILHGWNSHLKNWEPIIKLLTKQKINVYQPTMPGFGKKPTRNPMRTNDYANWLRGFIKNKNLKSVILVGHSFGGQVAIQFTASFPKLVNKLVLINSAGIRPSQTPKKLLFFILAKLGKLIFLLPFINKLAKPAKKILYKIAREGDYFKASPVMKQTLKLINKEDQQKNLSNINTPALILWGAKDFITPLKDGQKIHQLLSNSRLITFPSATHGLPFQKPLQVINKILWFIS